MAAKLQSPRTGEVLDSSNNVRNWADGVDANGVTSVSLTGGGIGDQVLATNIQGTSTGHAAQLVTVAAPSAKQKDAKFSVRIINKIAQELVVKAMDTQDNDTLLVTAANCELASWTVAASSDESQLVQGWLSTDGVLSIDAAGTATGTVTSYIYQI